MFSRVNLLASLMKRRARCLSTGVVSQAVKSSAGKGGSGESARMKKFRDKLKSDTGPSGAPGMQLDDLILVETDPNSGEAVADHEKEPTKWGDWQHGGRSSEAPTPEP